MMNGSTCTRHRSWRRWPELGIDLKKLGNKQQQEQQEQEQEQEQQQQQQRGIGKVRGTIHHTGTCVSENSFWGGISTTHPPRKMVYMYIYINTVASPLPHRCPWTKEVSLLLKYKKMQLLHRLLRSQDLWCHSYFQLNPSQTWPPSEVS